MVIASFILAFRSKLFVVPNAPTSWNFGNAYRHEDQIFESTTDGDKVWWFRATINLEPNS